MKIVIIGLGILGLICGYYLYCYYDIILFEVNDYIGGYIVMVDVEFVGKLYVVDMGFIVYNDRIYFNFIKMMDEIGV